MIPPGAEIVTEPAELIEHYADRRAAHVYALADLEEPFWTPSRWFRRGEAVVGVVSMPDGDGAAVYAVATTAPDEALALVLDLVPELPSGQLITGPEGLAEAAATIRPLTWHGPHLRYHLTDRSRLPTRSTDVVDLGRAELAELEALYATEPGAAFFLAHMIDDDTYVGVRRDGRLVSVAGTHVVSEDQGLAAIGAVYTHPDHRGQGLGAAATAAVVDRLGTRVDLIGLNVSEGNIAARTVYERLGFEMIWRYEECELA
ncbi:MAG: GNAT family N-acetyltransferase [Actinomycetota bacterium]